MRIFVFQFLICGLVVLGSFSAQSEEKRADSLNRNIPAEIVILGDQHIISVVGEDYFKKNYTLNKQFSVYSGTTGKNFSYRLHYNYAPVEKLGVQTGEGSHLIPVMVDEIGGVRSARSFGVADIRNGKITEPVITRDKAAHIATEAFKQFIAKLPESDTKQRTEFESFTLSVIYLQLFENKWMWKSTFSPPVSKSATSYCIKQFYVSLDAIDGSVLSTEKGGVCVN